MEKQSTLAVDHDLLAALYRGPLEPQPWRTFLQALARQAKCDNAALSLQLSRKGLAAVTIWAEPPPIDRQAMRGVLMRHADLGDMDPMSNALKRTGEIMLLDEVAPRAGLEQDQFYLEIMEPFGIAQAMGMYVAEPGGIECNLGLIAHSKDYRFTSEHRDLMAAIRPHATTALELFSRIQRDEGEIGALNDTLDRMTIATIILDGRGRRIRANKAATAMIERGDTFLAGSDRLHVAGRIDSRKFDEILCEALNARLSNQDQTFARAFRCADPGNAGLGLLVRTIPRERNGPLDIAPAVVVYATEPDANRSFEHLIATLFDLTPSEAQLAALLTQGYSLAEAASHSGLTESTTRSYSKRIYGKLGVSRQTELVRLILRSVAILG
jgi:DNA-binding CsgD family transcriptional regulator